MAHSRVRLVDIAKAYGCSANTVSKALRNSNDIPASTCEKIQEVARQMGYIRNSQASSLRSGKSHIIAVIVYDITNAYFSSMLSEIELALRKHGYDTMIFCSQPTIKEKERGIESIQIALSQSVDGIIYFPYWSDKSAVEFLESSHVPFVLVSHRVPETTAASVLCDDYMIGKTAAAHLAGLGHRKINYIAGPVNNSASYDRERGFFEVISSLQDSAPDTHIISSALWEETLANGDMLQLLKPDTYSAIFAFNDNVAYQIMQIFRNADIRIPEDVSLIGCDHIQKSVHFLAPLTSIALDHRYSLAEEAVRILLSRINDPNEKQQVTYLPVELYDGGTTDRVCSPLS